MYTLYTTYLAKAKEIPEGEVKVVIMRVPPFSVSQHEQFVHAPNLSPKKEALFEYKKTKEWEALAEHFNKLLNENEDTIEDIRLLLEALECNDVYLICCEKDPEYCHRRLIAEYMKKLGVICVEL